MLQNKPVRVSIPVQDMARAKRFYTETLAQTLLLAHDFAVVLESRGTQISLVPSQDAGRTSYSLATWLVEDIDAQMAHLRSAGVHFEEYDFGSIKTVDGKARIGNDDIAWFKDSEGNLLALAELHDDST